MANEHKEFTNKRSLLGIYMSYEICTSYNILQSKKKNVKIEDLIRGKKFYKF